MRLPDPFTDSNAPGFLSINITDNSTIIQDELPNNQVLQVDTGNHFWGINITYDQLLPEEFEIIRSFCFKAKVTNSTIEVLLPQFENYKFMLDSYSVKAGLSGNSIVITNVNSIRDQPFVGSVIKLSSHPKLYHITDYSYNSTTKEYTLGIYPKLAITTTGSETALLSAVLFTTRFKDVNSLTQTLNSDNVYEGFTLQLRETIS
jgi:hypothetical protein